MAQQTILAPLLEKRSATIPAAIAWEGWRSTNGGRDAVVAVRKNRSRLVAASPGQSRLVAGFIEKKDCLFFWLTPNHPPKRVGKLLLTLLAKIAK